MIAKKQKLSACITSKKLENFYQKMLKKIIVKNVLFELAQVLN